MLLLSSGDLWKQIVAWVSPEVQRGGEGGGRGEVQWWGQAGGWVVEGWRMEGGILRLHTLVFVFYYIS